MAITRIGLGGPGRSLGTITDKTEAVYVPRMRWGISGWMFKWILGYG